MTVAVPKQGRAWLAELVSQIANCESIPDHGRPALHP